MVKLVAWLLIATLPLVLGVVLGRGMSPQPESSPARPDPIFSSVTSRLGVVRVPVYVPSWLPSHPSRLQTTVRIQHDRLSYLVRLSQRSQRSLPFLSIRGVGVQGTAQEGRGPPASIDRETHPVRLTSDRWGYLSTRTHGGPAHALVWWRGPYRYEIDGQVSESDLVHIATSMVQVY